MPTSTHKLLLCGIILLMFTSTLLTQRAANGLDKPPAYNVKIAIVDLFDSTKTPDARAASQSTGNCALNLVGQVFPSQARAKPVPHGVLVMDELQALIDKYNAQDFIQLVPIPIESYQTGDIADQISQVLEGDGKAVAQAVAGAPSTFYVINMSFAIVQCRDLVPLLSYQGRLEQASRTGDSAQLRNLLTDDSILQKLTSTTQLVQQDKDPLQELFSKYASLHFVVPIAAAGDAGLSSPFAPGLWEGVISVSANNSNAWLSSKDTARLTLDHNSGAVTTSNSGGIIMPGVFKGSSGEVLGTSFAAPRMSFLVALYMSKLGDNYCRRPGSKDIIGLAYADPNSKILWSNLTLTDVAAKYCPELLKILP